MGHYPGSMHLSAFCGDLLLFKCYFEHTGLSHITSWTRCSKDNSSLVELWKLSGEDTMGQSYCAVASDVEKKSETKNPI